MLKHFGRYSTALILCVLGILSGHTQEKRTEVKFDFRVNSVTIDSLYGNNAKSIQELTSFLRSLKQDDNIGLTGVAFCGAASPEGSSALNRRLANNRLSALEQLVRNEINIPDSIITRDDSYIPWDYLKEQVELSSDLTDKEEVLAILNEAPSYVDYYGSGAKIDSRVPKLQKLNGGKVWKQLYSRYFANMRNACAVFVTLSKPMPAIKEPVADTVIAEPESMPVIDSATTDLQPIEEPASSRRLLIKTNGIGWALSNFNVAAEIDLAEHWSVTVPVYWSPVNYFTSTVKFRSFIIQPEARYWFSEKNDGWFAAAHLGMAWYNLALGGRYRIQDHDGDTPALGGGIAAGYRLPLSANGRLKLEFTIGAGVYSLHYDRFANEPNGQLVCTRKKTYFGLDQAAVTLAYSFDLNQLKGGRK